MKMKTARYGVLTVCILSLLLLGGGCTKKAVDAPSMGQEGTTLNGGTDIDYPTADSGGYSESTISETGTLDDTGAASGGQTGNLSVNMEDQERSAEYKKEHGRSSVGLSPIYFGFDQAIISADMADRMANNALFLKQMPAADVVVEGNSDKRGTKEYNLALGQRRAINAKQYLIDLGITPGRIRTVSYGEERPLFLGDDEFAYAQNRRADFILE